MNEYVARDSVLTVLDWDCASRDALNAIKAIPAADVEEVWHGRWIEQEEWTGVEAFGFKEMVVGSFKCSACGYEVDVSEGNFSYCPSCGAKMDDNVIQHTECVGNALGALDEVEELSRYIDANKMADELSKVPWHKREDEKQAVRMVKEFPTADVVEVVRCGECQHYNAGFECLIEGYGIERPADYFCADGKRKDGGRENLCEGGNMSEICTDNRFEVIAAYKKKLIQSTNIETSPDEMAVIDNVLFRFWQMGWLPPVPHGRLIDADKMKESIRKKTAFLRLIGGEFAEIAETLEKGFLQEVDNAPTIIEAEEGE